MIIKTTYKYIEFVKKIATNKFNRAVFFSILGIFIFFNMCSAFASEDRIGVNETHSDAVNVVKDITGVEGENTQSLDNKMNAARVLNIGLMICPMCYDNYENLSSDANVSSSTKLGLIGTANTSVKALLYNPPNVDVASHLAQEWVPGYEDGNTSVYAGGYEELQKTGVDDIWSRVRNIAYAFFVVVMIVGGFMIMFRNKIGGQMMVTLGNMIPDIVISLILVTFSFAIVGIAIDIGAILCRVVIDILYGANSPFTPVPTSDPFTILWNYMWSNASLNRENYLEAFADPVSIESLMTIVKTIGSALNPMGGVVSLAGIQINIITIIVAGIEFVGAIAVWITLLKAYVGLLINVITAPIQIMLSAVPGQAHMRGNWFGSVVKGVLTFPLVMAMINLPFALWGNNIDFTGMPGGLTNVNGTESGLEQVLGSVIDIDVLLVGILQIVMLFMAAQAPKFLDALFPDNTPKSVMEGVGKAKEAMSKIPLIGGLFK